jgi:hypothetical protein
MRQNHFDWLDRVIVDGDGDKAEILGRLANNPPVKTGISRHDRQFDDQQKLAANPHRAQNPITEEGGDECRGGQVGN